MTTSSPGWLAYFLILLLPFAPGCSSDETSSAATTNNENILVDTGDPSIPYIAFNKDGSSLSVTSDTVSEITGIYTSASGEKILIVTDDNGTPLEAHFNNAIMVFDNVRSNLIDIAVIIDGQTVQVFRDINYVNENPAIQGLLRQKNNEPFPVMQRGVRDLMRALVIAAGAAACGGTAIVTATATLGTVLPAVAAACASPIFGLYALANPPAPLANGDLSNEEYAVMLASSLITSTEAGLCAASASPLDCILALADAAHSVFDALDFRRRVRSSEIAAAQTTLGSSSSSFAVIGYQNINGSIGQNAAQADIKLSGSTTAPIISWPQSTATLLQVVRSNPFEIVYEIRGEPQSDGSGNIVATPFNIPVSYGDYTLDNIDPDQTGPDPSPALNANDIYSVIIINETGSVQTTATASLVFTVN